MAAKLNGQQNGLYSYDSFSGNKQTSENNFLWWCSGAHQKLLKDYPSEHIKYAGLGGVVLATFVLASLSAGYAIYSVFGDWLWTVIFALIWGLIIFNFDRFLISTMRKYGVSTRKQVWMAIPRIILALLIGFTIARPLELKIFEKEINTQVTENIHKKILHNDSLLQKENLVLQQKAESERARMLARKLSIEDTLHRLQQSYLQEADGTGGSGLRGIKDITQLKQDAYNNALRIFSPEIQQLDKGIQQEDSTLSGARSATEGKRKQYEAEANRNVGFLERNKALSDLSDKESSVFLTSLFLSLLIILIETGPILSKLIMPVGPYDIALAREELTQMAASENEIRKDKALVFEKMKGVYAKKNEVSGEMAEKVTEMQKKYLKEELDKWEKGEWDPKSSRVSIEEVMKKIKERYEYNEENLI